MEDVVSLAVLSARRIGVRHRDGWSQPTVVAGHEHASAMRYPGGFGTLGDVPLMVISRGPRDPTTNSPTQPEWLAAQAATWDYPRERPMSSSRKAATWSNSEAIIAAIRRQWREER